MMSETTEIHDICLELYDNAIIVAQVHPVLINLGENNESTNFVCFIQLNMSSVESQKGAIAVQSLLNCSQDYVKKKNKVVNLDFGDWY